MRDQNPTMTDTIVAHTHIHDALEAVLVNDAEYLSDASENADLTADMLDDVMTVLNALTCSLGAWDGADGPLREALGGAWSAAYTARKARKEG